MAYLAKFVKGGRELDVSSSPYKLATSFVPSSSNISSLTSVGTSANRYGGGEKISERANNIIWTLPVIFTGDSEAEVSRARRDLAAFMALGSDRFTPMYFEFRANVVVTQEPKFGQFGANVRYEIVHIDAPDLWSMYGVGSVNKYGEQVEITLTCKPFVLGKRQVLGTATGGLTEDRVGTTDGFSRGLSIPKATTNDFSNPIFASSSFASSWDVGADLVTDEVTDPRYVLFGNSSTRILATGSTNVSFKEDLTLSAGSYHLSCYAKLPDGGAITSSHIILVFEGTGQTTTYTSVGDGWYRLNFADTTAGGVQACGVAVTQGVTVYVDGFQIEFESSFVTAPVFAGLVGVTSSGTEHQSDTTRAVGTLSFPIDEVISQDEGTIRIVWDARYAASGAVNRTFFSDSNGSLTGYLDSAHRYQFHDGTNSAVGTANQPSNHEKLILHFVYGGGEGLKVYLNGSEEVSTGSYTVPATKATSLYIGSDESSASLANGIFMEFSTYDVAMTSTEVSADYNALLPLVNDGKRISPIPFLWTKDGDDIVDNADDSTRDNWAVAGGIPGTHPAETRIDGEVSPGWTGYGLWISNLISNEIINPGGIVYGEQQGTVDANASGGEYSSKTVTTSAQTWSTSLSALDLEALFNREVYLFTRLYDAGSLLTIAFRLVANSDITTDYKSISTTTAFRLFKTDPLFIADLAVHIPGSTPGYNSPTFYLSAKRTLGSAAARVDFNIMMPRPLLFMVPGATAAGSPEGFSYTSQDNRALSKTSADVSIGLLETRGDRIELVPNRYNALISLIGDIAGTHTITHTLTYERIYVTPRWSVI